MNALVSRVYAGENDLQAMVALTQALRLSGQKVYPIAADLYEELVDPEVQVTARLWEDDQCQLVGFVYVDRYQNLVEVFAAPVFTQALQDEMIDWAAAAVRQRNQMRGETQTLDAAAREQDQARLAMLERHGFVRLEESSLLMSRPLTGDLPEPVLPPGFTIRPLRGEAELEAYVSLHQAAFGTGVMTLAYRQAIMCAPDYLPELDLVAVAPDGTLAALCMCQIFPDDAPRAGGIKEGWTDPVATHPAYQRQGLGKALLLAGMRRLQARGLDTAVLGTMSDNLPMQRLAESVGFRIVTRTIWYSLTV